MLLFDEGSMGQTSDGNTKKKEDRGNQETWEGEKGWN
jgi:hypothetical protein